MAPCISIVKNKDLTPWMFTLLTEAYADLEAAQVLRQAGIHARCIAHCQHTVEKALRAALAVRDLNITDRHEVSEDVRQS